MSKEIIIVALIVLVIYLYYQQNNQPNLLGNSENQEQITKLQQEVQHYQNLYQKRVEKDLETDQTERIKELEESKEQLEQKHTEVLKLFQQKVKDQDTALINLARTKIKGKKDAEILLKNLTENWEKDKELWKNTEADYLGKLQEANKDCQQKERTIIGLNNSYDKLAEEKKALERQNQPENWPQEKQTIFQNYDKDKRNWQNRESVYQEQLRKINVLFDEKAKDYETIDFSALYSLLEIVKAEREREREQK